MMRSLWTAASGMMAQQTNLDTISNNLANVNTPGFKKQRTGFQDLLYDNLRPATPAAQQDARLGPIQIGSGVKVGALSRLQTPGAIESTGNPLDVAIDGSGFFRVNIVGGATAGDGVAYTRDGSFRLGMPSADASASLVTQDGYAVQAVGGGTIKIPAGATDISIGADGTVTATGGHSGQPVDCGKLGLYLFSNPGGLLAVGKNLYTQTGASGTAAQASPGKDGAGTFVQSFVERSNVQVVEEMVNLIVVQRAYEMNVKSVQSSDEIMGMTNNLVRR